VGWWVNPLNPLTWGGLSQVTKFLTHHKVSRIRFTHFQPGSWWTNPCHFHISNYLCSTYKNIYYVFHLREWKTAVKDEKVVKMMWREWRRVWLKEVQEQLEWAMAHCNSSHILIMASDKSTNQSLSKFELIKHKSLSNSELCSKDHSY